MVPVSSSIAEAVSCSALACCSVRLDRSWLPVAICAEAVALGQAITVAGDSGIESIVAVRHPPPEDEDLPIVVVVNPKLLPNVTDLPSLIAQAKAQAEGASA